MPLFVDLLLVPLPAATWYMSVCRPGDIPGPSCQPSAAPCCHNLVQVSVQTGDVRGAGTDADISVILISDTGESQEMKLDNSKNNFERNMVGWEGTGDRGSCRLSVAHRGWWTAGYLQRNVIMAAGEGGSCKCLY